MQVQGQDLPVLDISIGGMKLPLIGGSRAWRGQIVEFEMRSSHWPNLRPARGKAEIRAVGGIQGNQWMALQFVRPSYDLLKYVSRHVAGLVWGDKPYGY